MGAALKTVVALPPIESLPTLEAPPLEALSLEALSLGDLPPLVESGPTDTLS